METISGAPGAAHWWDKVPSKFSGWDAADFTKAGFRAVPGAIVRRGAFVGKGAVLMPSFVNIGAYVGEGTMVDTWATVGSCAQIGSNVHISGGAGIGGVLEPLQAGPVIIEDNCFIGARSEVAEGVVVEEGAVLSMGVSRLFGCRPWHASAQGRLRSRSRLRRDRQAGRCQDAVQDEHQRTASRLIGAS
jgi:2,3,4,5-tetrahydropyridine-2-carboxylate N-succinyltransferase